MEKAIQFVRVDLILNLNPNNLELINYEVLENVEIEKRCQTQNKENAIETEAFVKLEVAAVGT